MNRFRESVVEEAALAWLEALRYTVLHGPEIAVGEPCVLVGWEFGRDGRRHYTGTALYATDGQCRGVARGTWFEVPAK